MRSDKKHINSTNRESRRQAAVNGDASFDGPVSKLKELAGSKNDSGENVKRNSGTSYIATMKRQSSEPRMLTPTHAPASLDRDGKKKNTSNSIGASGKLSLSTPRRRRDLLASLHSDLSPKYIGFTTPPSTFGAVCNGNGSESDGGLQTRSTRRRKLLIYAASPDIGGSDTEILSDTSTLLGCVRRSQVLTPSPKERPVRKKFESPIDKLLVRNGATALSDISKEKIVKNLDAITTSTTNSHVNGEVLKHLDGLLATSSVEDSKDDIEFNKSSQKSECIARNSDSIGNEDGGDHEKKQNSHSPMEEYERKVSTSLKETSLKETSLNAVIIKEEVSIDEHDKVQMYDANLENQNINVDIESENLQNPEKELHADERFVINPLTQMKTDGGNSESIESHVLDNGDETIYDLEGGESGESMILNNAAGLSAKSPSAASLDSAKGSSIVTTGTWMSFSTGDIFWGQIYTYCYWPCIVCPDPDGKTIATEQNMRSGGEYVMVHVRFFADSGRRNWVKRENLIPYTDLEHYKQHMREVRKKYGKKSVKYKLLLPKQSKVMIWREAIKEANKVAELLHEERLAKFFEMYEHKKVLKNLQRKQRKLSIDNTSSTSSFRNDSMENLKVKNPLAAVKRDRSASPYSPAYSPLKPISTIKRRKLSDASTLNTKTPDGSSFGCDNTDQQIDESNKNSSCTTTQTMEVAEANTSNSFTALHESDLLNNDEYRKFFAAMKDFVLEDNIDDSLEKSLVVAVRNIWALKHINRQQMQRRLLLCLNDNELGSTLVGDHCGEGTVKRLSNRLKTLKYRHSLPAKIKDNTSVEHLQPQTREIQHSVEQVRRTQSNDNRPKRQMNRPIEEVIDDIFNLDNKYLFRGLARDPVCKYCLHPGGALYKCAKGNCQTWMHVECIGKSTDLTLKKGKRPPVRRKSSSQSNSDRWNTHTPKSYIDDEKSTQEKQSAAPIELDEDCAASTVTPSVTTPYHVTADGDVDVDNSNTIVVIEKPPTPVVFCDNCAQGKPPTCLVCQKDNSVEELFLCNMINCAKTFHPTCCRYWPQAKFTKSKNQIETFRCPSHVCHTCVSDDPKGKFQHLSNAKLTKCVKCPASYHMDSTCIPAGSQILTAAHIICPRHSTSSKSDGHVNVSWCFICVGGGQVICCETCPTAVHAKCLNITLDPNEGYICEECESGRLPLYGEMVWAKFTSFRWWPAIILPPTEVPQNIRRKSHNSNEFVVRFFGTHDHGWISRRRVYLYLEGDSSEPPKTKSGLDYSYNRGVEEAKRIYDIIKSKKLAQRLTNERKEKLHPQPYVRIKANRAVHPVKLHVDLEKVNKCECKWNDEEPCGPNSNCLNRVLYHECNPKVCPAGERCLNQMFESRLSPRLDVVYLRERGFGLVCREPIKTGDFVIEYVGEIIDDNEFKQRMSQKSMDRDENFYFLSVEKDYIIDAGPKGNLARFMNHSCDPNCETQKWSVNGLNRIGLFAIKDIPADTELTFNYHWDDLLGNEKKLCLCGAAKCAGEIGGKSKEEKVVKENSNTTDASSKSTRKRKPLKRLTNRRADNGRKRAKSNKRAMITVKVPEVADAAAKVNSNEQTIDGEKIVDVGGNNSDTQEAAPGGGVDSGDAVAANAAIKNTTSNNENTKTAT